MGVYTGANTWQDEVYQFEETDVVQGGPDGIDNQPIKDLADRTVWLKNQLGIVSRLNDVVEISTGTINNTHTGKLIVAYSNSLVNITLDTPANFDHGAIIPIAGYCESGSVINILSPSFPIYDISDVRAMYMHQKEKLWLAAFTDHWRVINASGNFYSAGDEVKSRKIALNSLPFDGQLVRRDRYPRLWTFVQSLTLGQEVVTETQYFSDPYKYRGCYTTGDGSTNFRLPDERGMSERMMDRGRGVDVYRLHAYPGGYEADRLQAHNHPNRDRYYPENIPSNAGAPYKELMPPSLNNKIGSGDTDYDNIYFAYMDTTTGNNGTSIETTVKNIGKINQVKF